MRLLEPPECERAHGRVRLCRLGLGRGEPATAAPLGTGSALFVVARLEERVGQHGIGLVDQGEALRRGRIARVLVRVVLLDERAIGRLDDGGAGIRADFEQFVQRGFQGVRQCCLKVGMVNPSPPFANPGIPPFAR